MPIHSEPHSTPTFREGLWIKVLISIIIIASLGSLSGLLTSSSISDWYVTLEKPVFNPPNWLFGPAWLTLYVLMGVSFARMWQVAVRSRYPLVNRFAKRGLIIFVIHFVFNLAWTPVFFGLHEPGWALVIIFIILAFIIILIRHFFRIDRIAAFLLIPYLAWVSFATLLNASIVYLN